MSLHTYVCNIGPSSPGQHLDLTVDLHSAGRSCISSITSVGPRIADVTLHDLKKPLSSHCVNAQVFAGLHCSPVLKEVS